ncbi:MAG: NAD(P)/FAD-dependent oxidoreductase [Myxococcales bacterium]|nr:NAD(P)/FAD-dependent oxidoreductase [Myxococcales bacterium]
MSAASSGHEQAVDVLIIGAGISGIGAAIVLREHGFDDVLILEKADALGGTWRDNTYPGCACDVPSALYSYSFAQRADWSRAFAGQAEILAYVQDTAERFGVLDRIRFGEPLESAKWDDARGRWTVRTTRGSYAARILISCAGYLHEPQLPDVLGLSAFEGPVFHSSRWDHGVDLRGKRVAVVGTGASAVQFVPQIQPDVAELVLFQRTPHWVLPKPNPSMPAASQQLLDLPRAKETLRAMLYRGFEGFGVGFRHPELLRRLQFLGEAHIARAVRDPALREVLTPRYTLGCKRVLLSNDYYPALAQPNVTVLPTGLGAVRGDVVVGSDGTERRADVIILGTGFHVSDPPIAERIQRADGHTLAQVWSGSPEAHRGTAIAGFPNAFLVLGPNLAIGNNSAFVVIESQLRYITAALSWMRRTHTDVVEVRADRQAAYNAEVQRDLASTVWNTGGCQSYYLDANGRNSIGFPWSTDRMQALLAEFDHDNYDKRSPRAARGHVATTRA